MTTYKSSTVTNIELTTGPSVKASPGKVHGRLHVCQETISVEAAYNNNDDLRLFRVHSSWVPVHIWLYNDAITSGSAYDFGLYDIEGGAAVDADLFVTDLSMTSARTTAPIDLMYEVLNITNVGKPIWELLGLSSDPGKWYDFGFDGDTVGSGQGDVTVVFEYIAGD